MRSSLLFTLLLLVSVHLFSQQALPGKQIELAMGYSNHGTGDLPGAAANFGYSQYINRSIFWNAGFGATMHRRKEFNASYNDGSRVRDNGLWNVAAGMQLQAGLGYSLFRSAHHCISIVADVVARGQYASLGYNSYTVFPAASTNFPGTVVLFNNNEPHSTISLGYRPRLQYQYTCSDQITLGITAGFQNDTNSDDISFIQFTIGKRFGRKK